MAGMLQLSAGDTAPALTGTVNAVLTGATVVIEVERADGTTFTRPATVTNGPGGAWSATFAAGSLTVPGVYKAEPVVDYSDGGHQRFTVGSLYFRVA